MSFLDSLASLALRLSAKVFPVEPTSAKTPEPESPEEEFGQPIEQVQVADQASFVDDEEPSESDAIGQMRTDLEDALAQIDAITQDLDVLKFENKEEERDLHDEQDLGFTLSAIAAGATGRIRHAVYQEGAVVQVGDSCTAYNLGPAAAGISAVVMLQFGDHPVPCFTMGGDGAVANQTQIIKAQTAIAGTATTPPRSDGVMGLLLNGAPATDAVELDTDNPRSDLEFVKNNETSAVRRGLRVRANRPANAAAGDYPATGGETNPTLRTTGDKGLDVLLAQPQTGYENATDYAYLSAILAAAHVSRGGLAMLLDRAAATGCLNWTTAGLCLKFGDGLTIASNLLKVLLASNPGLEFNGTELRVKVKSGGGITRDADGLSAGGGGGGGDVFTSADTTGALSLTADNAWHDLVIGAAGDHGVSIAVSWYPANAAEGAAVRRKGNTNATWLLGATPGALSIYHLTIGVDAAGTIQYRFPTHAHAYAAIHLLGSWAPAP